MEGFGSFEVALGRYFFYGLISLALLAYGRFELLYKVDRRLWWKAFFLGLAGNLLYYFTLVVCMRDSGEAISALMLGVSPITIAWYGNWLSRESQFRGLILPSIITAIGLLLVNLPAMQESAQEGFLGRYLVGLSAGFLALGLWTWYAVSSKVVLSRYPTVSPSDWSTILGAATLVSVFFVMGGILTLQWNSPHLTLYKHWSGELQTFLLSSAFLGIFCSWIGFYLWSKGSGFISAALAGQLLIFETLFGLCFVYILDNRLPNFLEGLGIFFMLIGILTALVQTRQEQIARAKHA